MAEDPKKDTSTPDTPPTKDQPSRASTATRVSEGDPKAPDTGDIGLGAPEGEELATHANPSLPQVEEGVEAPAYRDPSGLKTDRVFREGEPDLNALSDSSYTASGNRYPMSASSADGLARNLEGQAKRLENQAKVKREEADAARKIADELKASEEGK